MTEEYDPQELEDLVKSALTEKAEPSRALFDVGGTRILESLDDVLKDYVHTADRTFIIDRLRDVLYEDVQSTRPKVDRLKALHAIQANCTACPMAIEDPKLPHWNLSDPQVVIVTDKPLTVTPNNNLIVEALKSAGFSSSRVAATSVVRCESKSGKVEGSMVENCVSRYLFTELQLLAPQLIIACGSVSASVLASEQIKVTEKMGTVFWVGPWPVFVTTSPGYASRSEKKIEEFLAHFKQAFSFLNG